MADSILLFESIQPTKLESVRVLRQSLSKILDHLDIKTNVKQHCLLCCSEWCTNLIIHATPPSRDITVSFRKSKKKWLLLIKDNGETWDPTMHRSIIDARTKTDILKGCGYGINIINNISDGMFYQSQPTYNLFTILWERDTHRIKPHILLVEDNTSQVQLYCAYLKPQFSVSIAANGRQALTFLKNEKVDLIISDIQMPEMSGIELRQQLEKIKTSSTPFIFLSHSLDEAIIHDAVDLGIDDYLKKPIKKKAVTQFNTSCSYAL
ncbi:response regulator [Photobacterium kishitanii]|uniref:response regulator n=1 Tax=Photobacterium kishitanii TaxID=318456 RepID=UPI000AF94F28|nr:response regulator [Photobacterium kishitanii]